MSISVLFVCLGNICRSPTAHGVFQQLVHDRELTDRIRIDSAGTAAWHVGKQPDSRSIAAAANRGCDLSSLRARQVSPEDFLQFDYILAMDRNNYELLLQQCPPEYISKLSLILSYLDEVDNFDVPDPYYGSVAGFEKVCGLLDIAVKAFAERCLIQLEE